MKCRCLKLLILRIDLKIKKLLKSGNYRHLHNNIVRIDTVYKIERRDDWVDMYRSVPTIFLIRKVFSPLISDEMCLCIKVFQ